MAGGAHTHRDTLAFVLSIIGAIAWSMLPVGGLLYGPGEDPAGGLLTIALVGALLGAWTAASVWREVHPSIAAMAGGLCMAALVGANDLVHRARISVDVFEVVTIALVALAAFGGAVVGRRAEIPRVALTASWITIGASAIGGAGLVVLEANHALPGHPAMVLVAFLIPFAGALLAAWFCHVRPGALAGRLFLLSTSAAGFLVLTTPDFDGEDTGNLMASATAFGLILAAFGALAAWIGHTIRQRQQIAPPLPSAHVVDR